MKYEDSPECLLVGALVLGGIFLCYSARLISKCLPCSARRLLCALLSVSSGVVCFAALTRKNLKGNAKTNANQNRFQVVHALLFCFRVCHLPAPMPQKSSHYILFATTLAERRTIAAIRNGKSYADKVVESRTKDEVFVFGSGMCSRTPEKKNYQAASDS